VLGQRVADVRLLGALVKPVRRPRYRGDGRRKHRVAPKEPLVPRWCDGGQLPDGGGGSPAAARGQAAGATRRTVAVVEIGPGTSVRERSPLRGQTAAG